MENKEIKITVPEGFEIDNENSTPTNIIIKKIENKKPMSWEEYCSMNIGKTAYYYETFNGNIIQFSRMEDSLYTIFKEPDEVEAFVSLGKLIQLRDAWWGDWKPDWTNLKKCKYIINIFDNHIIKDTGYRDQSVLAFPTAEMRTEFLETFRPLIEKAKMYL